MKFIARHLNLIGLLLLTAFGAAAAGLYFQTPGSTKSLRAKAAAPAAAPICPLHPNVTSTTQSNCPECGMKLIAVGSEKTAAATGTPKNGCCAEKPAAAAPPADGCCSKPVNP